MLRQVNFPACDIQARFVTNLQLLKADNAMSHDRTANNPSLTEKGFLRGLDRFIHLNPSALGHVGDKLMATTVEAVIGAIYLDSGYDMGVVRSVIIRLGLLEE